jgi:thiol-disulfide isomerase/thioredoxin
MRLFLRNTILAGLVFALFPAMSAGISTISGLHATPVYAGGSTSVDIYLFYGDGCPHCAKEREFVSSLEQKYGEKVVLHEYEVYYDSFNSKLFGDVVDRLGTGVAGVPLAVYGETFLVGYESDQTSGAEIESEIERCLSEGCGNLFREMMSEGIKENEKEDGDVRGLVKAAEGDTADEGDDSSMSNSKGEDPVFLKLPIIGRVDLKNISLPAATILIAFVDGFNPCAMWILIFLITMLINMKDRKKLYILGSVFIITSGLVYLVFLAAWFNFFKLIGFVYWLKVIIGIVAIASGVLHVRNALSSKGGCHATGREQRETIMERIKKALSEKSFLFSVIGIMTLAVSVNLIEVVCSAGLPAIYTNLLSSISLSAAQYYFYLILYVIVFMIDDLFVFFIAVKTFEVTGITEKYTKWSSLIGGIIIGIIGVILIVKPELLMFG